MPKDDETVVVIQDEGGRGSSFGTDVAPNEQTEFVRVSDCTHLFLLFLKLIVVWFCMYPSNFRWQIMRCLWSCSWRVTVVLALALMTLKKSMKPEMKLLQFV